MQQQKATRAAVQMYVVDIGVESGYARGDSVTVLAKSWPGTLVSSPFGV
jgi:hypothetical protein